MTVDLSVQFVKKLYTNIKEGKVLKKKFKIYNY